MTRAVPDPGKSVARRTLAVLGSFDLTHPLLTLSEISRRSGLPLATCHRLVSELLAWGALERDDHGVYRIGMRLWEAGLLAPVATDVRSVAGPYLQELQRYSGENVQLAIRDEYGGLYLEKLSGHESVPIFSQVGTRVPMHATAVGKMLLATADDQFIDSVLAGDLSRFTRRTITDPDVLRRVLSEARTRGYAITREETMDDAGSVAVAVPTTRRDLPVVLGIVFRTERDRDEAGRLVPLLRFQAKRIGERLSMPEVESPGKRQAPERLPRRGPP